MWTQVQLVSSTEATKTPEVQSPMDGSLPLSYSSHTQETSPKATSTRSGLTLVLPSLKNLKAAKAAKKSKAPTSNPNSPAFDAEVTEKKAPRPVKLKPLKEVLTKLIQQIKKKDDYAFFLEPVDPSQVPGYLDAIKRPMDFGTMTNKITRGKYRSLEEFANDIRLVTANARTFNPPGSIYCTEADRIEAWALDHIAKASSTVIQYETDWNIDIEKDDDTAVNIDDDDDDNPATPIPPDDVALNGRSPSVASQLQQSTGRRGPRGPNKKAAPPTTVSESIDSEGRLPGSRDGIGAFPPCSDWAKTMVALKLKGKRYKTKKERLRFEKEGPPYLPDGSLDYTEMEDPFSVLSNLVPDSPSRPHLTPVYPPLSIPCTSAPLPPSFQAHSVSEDSTPQPELPISTSASQDYRPSVSFPSTISLPLNYDPSSFINLELPPATTYSKRRHWHIVRNPTGRKGKDNADDAEIDEPPWRVGREAHPTDFGSFAVLAGALSEEMKKRGITPGVLKEGEEEKVVFDILRDDLGLETEADKSSVNDDGVSSSYLTGPNASLGEYFTPQRTAGAEDYIRDVVYGGVDGFAYVRSLSEFVGYNQMESPQGSSGPAYPVSELGLGMSLNQYVQGIVDELTEGRHSLLSETARQLYLQTHYPMIKPDPNSPLAVQIATSLYLAPKAAIALDALLQINSQKIDMSALINKPEELFLSEEEWAGKGLKEKRKAMLEKADTLARKRFKMAEDSETMEVDGDVTTSQPGLINTENAPVLEMEGPEELAEVLEYVANLIIELNRRMNDTGDTISLLADSPGLPATSDKTSDGNGTSSVTTREDSTMRNLRLNLLALAKRAPLDTIARLPLELVPEHIRHYIPTLDTSVTVSPSGSSTSVATPTYVPPAGITPVMASSTPSS